MGEVEIFFPRDFRKDSMSVWFHRKRIGSLFFVCLEEVWNCLFPLRCPICDIVLVPQNLICDDCRERVKRAAEPVCKRCGKPLENETAEYCSDCGRREHKYRQGKAVFLYDGAMRQSMYRFKYSNKREYAVFYAKEAAEMYAHWILQNQIEVIVPIPMYRGKKRQRGYNQAEVFAKALGRELNLPVDSKLIRRVRNTTPQKELNVAERKRNLKKAFQLGANIVEYSQVLVVDDIYTTGSTIDAVAEVLLAVGIKNIYYICISIGSGC